MELDCVSFVERTMWERSVLEAMAVETVFTTANSLACLLAVAGAMLNIANGTPGLAAIEERFPFSELHKKERPDQENKDATSQEEEVRISIGPPNC
ncbi:phosphopantothenoylcysteine decarboxylase subunit VHS3-like [Cucumis melo var. makuwa]|uniref:Phosphopantothenoylcysteine decarboxylase subunit VHS3-like n=1 Tax=Cucumis melo var. makuwa TaxID=1194695 RepID=A0A5A7V8I6_CUCMM|nr:phosphopantothenoylcysteine decarboxylase subunit VHS3-like [Cucumis melo var. makuwa]TYJ97841.1 phosphopantothenoylcysteine decarboxylase subunit VHS3-like [Cucumis melo var. makuwa]